MGSAGFQCLQICLVDLLENDWFSGDKDKQTFCVQLWWSAAKCRDFHVSLCSFLWSLGARCLFIKNSCIMSRIVGRQDANIWSLEMWSISNANVTWFWDTLSMTITTYVWAQSYDYLSFRIHRLSCLWWWVGWSWRPGKQEFWLCRKKIIKSFNKTINIDSSSEFSHTNFIRIFAGQCHILHIFSCITGPCDRVQLILILDLFDIDRLMMLWSYWNIVRTKDSAFKI